MSVYAIGDIQGCLDEFERLLDKLAFGAHDRLWLSGDLVNRGPQSLQVLRRVKSMDKQVVTVLGNHDLHLLAVAYGQAVAYKRDTLDSILSAPDKIELIEWLRHRPVMHYDNEINTALVHAGLPPDWSVDDALEHADALSRCLQSDEIVDFLHNMYGNLPNCWSPELSGWQRLRYITNCFTRLRYVNREGCLDLTYKGAPGDCVGNLIPWFEHPRRRSQDIRIVFGHWSTLGYLQRSNIIALDSGCLWGGALSAVELIAGQDSAPLYQIDCLTHCQHS